METKMNKAPYSAPLKSRKAITDYILSEQGCRESHCDYHNSYFFSFNVKLYNLKTDFDSLFKRFLESGEVNKNDSKWSDEDYLGRLEELFNKIDKNDLFDSASKIARDGVLDTDSYRAPWDSDIYKDIDLTFFGRNGGWLGLSKYDGTDLSQMRKDDVEEWLNGMSFQELRYFYKWLVMCETDFGGEKPEREVEYQAAFVFFLNIADKVEEPLAFVGQGI